jgi:transposase
MSANQERSEDLAWMAEHWETPKEAARRLGISLNALDKWAARYAPDVMERLRLNEARRKGCVA